MKKIIISNLPERAAIEFAEGKDPEYADFSIIPSEIGRNVEFWAKLCEIDPKFISRVPEQIVSSEEFAQMIDHKKFYHYIPRKFLTIEDFEDYKRDRTSAIFANGCKAQINQHNEFIWYTFNNSSYNYPASKITAREVFNHIDEMEKASEICSEIWSQELADLLWESPLAIISYDAIPKEFVRDEWTSLMTLFKEKRQNTAHNPKLLKDYWSNFKDYEKIRLAIELEKLVRKCANPYGYAVNISFSQGEAEDVSQYFQDMWLTIKPIIENHSDLIDEFFNLYGFNFSKVIPEEYFKIDWIINSRNFEYNCRLYKRYLKKMDDAESDVERLEIQEDVDDIISSMREMILAYRNLSDEEVQKIIESAIADE